jgi:hypothetical protein
VPVWGQMCSKLAEVVPPTCNFSLDPFYFLIVVHMSHASCVMFCVPLYVVCVGWQCV